MAFNRTGLNISTDTPLRGERSHLIKRHLAVKMNDCNAFNTCPTYS